MEYIPAGWPPDTVLYDHITGPVLSGELYKSQAQFTLITAICYVGYILSVQ